MTAPYWASLQADSSQLGGHPSSDSPRGCEQLRPPAPGVPTDPSMAQPHPSSQQPCGLMYNCPLHLQTEARGWSPLSQGRSGAEVGFECRSVEISTLQRDGCATPFVCVSVRQDEVRPAVHWLCLRCALLCVMRGHHVLDRTGVDGARFAGQCGCRHRSGPFLPPRVTSRFSRWFL